MAVAEHGAPRHNDITIHGVSKAFTTNGPATTAHHVVLENLTFSVRAGELCTVFGPNGCGKTTLLNLLAGLAEPDSGSLAVAGNKPRPGRAAYVFQNFKDSLFPWRNTEGNLLFPLECQIPDPAERRQRLTAFVREFEFPLPLNARVYQLSVGQQQLLCVARALITRPAFLLMDEPFSALDFRMRRAMQERLLTYWRQSGATILLVSHELDEAIYLGQRVILFPPKPTSNIHEVVVPFPQPRSREILYSNECFHIRSEILRFLDEQALSHD